MVKLKLQSNNTLIYWKVVAADKTRNIPTKFYDVLATQTKKDKRGNIRHILISSFNHERILKTTDRTTAEKSGRIKSSVLLASKKTKDVSLHQQLLSKEYLSPRCKTLLLPDGDNIKTSKTAQRPTKMWDKIKTLWLSLSWKHQIFNSFINGRTQFFLIFCMKWFETF